MTSPIDDEPSPHFHLWPIRRHLRGSPSLLLPKQIDRPETGFFDVLDERRSCVGKPLSVDQLSSLLWHSTRLRDRRLGRFGIGQESRSAPSGGGLHPIRLLILPLGQEDGGLYDDHDHALIPIDAQAKKANSDSMYKIFGDASGVTIQFAADSDLVAACYSNPMSLIWRDAGALAATICLVATALKLAAVPVGRLGTNIVEAAGMPSGFIGAGAVHISSSFGSANEMQAGN